MQEHGPTQQTHEPTQQTHEPGHEGGFDLGEMLGHHILNSSEYELPFIGPVNLPHWPELAVGGLTIDVSPTKHVILLLLAALITAGVAILAGQRVARSEAGRAPSGLANAIEAVVVYFRDDLCKGYIGHGYQRFVPLVLTLFFFILTMNLLGLVPWGGSATGNIMVTATLALVTFVVVEVSGFVSLGPRGYLKTIFFVPPGVSGAMKYVVLAVMTPVEFMGKFLKPFALAIRLFANMTAGHVLIFSVLGFIFLFGNLSYIRWMIAAGSYGLVSAILLLEVLIAFIQAYVFAMLTAAFIGLIRHPH
jgi:F-type H+-transporting ATPase subunit a